MNNVSNAIGPTNEFQRVVGLCQRPDQENLRSALQLRNQFTREQADFITYLAGFTHYDIAREILGEFGLVLTSAQVPILIDKPARRVHAKVALIDRTGSIAADLLSDGESWISGFPRLANHINLRRRDGTFAGSFSEETSNLDYG